MSRPSITGRSSVVNIRSNANREQRQEALTALIGDMVRMSSVLSSLLEDRVRDTGQRSLAVDRRDAADLQFIASQAAAYADRVQAAWEALP
jgi:hypothetical protein